MGSSIFTSRSQMLRRDTAWAFVRAEYVRAYGAGRGETAVRRRAP